MSLTDIGLFHDSTLCRQPGHEVKIHGEQHLQNKETVNITFAFDRTCHAYLGLGVVLETICGEWAFISTP
jgi:hypothetical protein